MGKKNIGTLIKFGSGKKDGVAKLWLSKDQEELVEQLTATAIDCIRQLFMLISWKAIQHPKYSNNHLIQLFYSLRVSELKMSTASHFQQSHKC